VIVIFGINTISGNSHCDVVIQLLSEEMASELVHKTHNNIGASLYSVFTDYMADVLTNFNAEQLDELFNNKLIKEKEQNDVL